MAADRLSEALDATYACLSRYGVRRTTVDDIAREMGVSRSAVYQYVRGKDDAVRKLAMRLHDRALARAEAAAVAPVPPAERVHGILAAKLDLVLDLTGRSPHAVELLDPGARLSGDICDAFTARLRALLTEQFTAAGRDAAVHGQVRGAVAHGQAVAGPGPVRASPGEPAALAPTPAQCADICLALVVGLETAPDAARLLRPATDALLTGLLPHRTAPLRPLQRTTS
ncbi:transcriptional regulator BetI [Streptomyces sp. YIM 121038]|uniref:TetR/AcrR family transcriptional regulator n=1 Tax=Streptomyces sp. YIM 121038 TaxID=2136401 RepID=UPI001110509A|nr:TetR/AcrR family transcriptional regulator [Streptomyces sp. YIM 121038]QCX81334.1 transcriptional regulator BetI [Streptomyces sp. YIM 121038]